MVINSTLIKIKSILTISKFTRSYVVILIDIVNQSKLIELRKKFSSLFKSARANLVLQRKVKNKNFEKELIVKKNQKRFSRN